MGADYPSAVGATADPALSAGTSVGVSLVDAPTTEDVLAAEFAVRAIGVTKVYGTGGTTVRALDGVRLDIPSAQFTAVMGPSGSGKSTLLHCLAGLDRVTSGTIWLGEREITACSEKELTLVRRDQIGFVFQAYNLIPVLNAQENIVLPLSLAGRTPEQGWLDQVVDTLGLRDRLRHRPAELSGGQQQRVAVARALIGRPKVVFADEPTGNLDSRASGEVLKFIRDAVDEFGQTVVMVTHDPLAASYADSVVFVADGRVVDVLDHPTTDTIFEHTKKLGA